MLRIKPHTHQRCTEGSNKTCVHQEPEAPKRLSQTAFECLSVSCGGISQQWPAMGTEALAAADQDHTECGINPLGRGHQ